MNRKVSLKSGGHVVFDQTEAMTTIDVNTGAYVGHRNLEETIFRTNLEAAAAIARQLRLRNLGGIIIIDFIDMAEEEHRRQVLQTLTDRLAGDHAKSHVMNVSPLGLVEMTRKRNRESLEHLLCQPCPSCEGRGFVKTAETVCHEIFREILRQHRQFDFQELLVLARPQVIERLLDEDSAGIAELEEVTGKPIRLQSEGLYAPDQFDVVLMYVMGLLRKLARITLLTLLSGAAFVVLAMVGFKLLVRQLPDYQDEIQAWVIAELGLELDYTQLDAAWGWRGPELAFRDVRVRAAGDAAPFLTASTASVGFKTVDLLFRLATGRKLGADRLTFDGTELTLVRNEDAYRLQGAPQTTREQASVRLPQDIEVLVRNSRVLYLDAARSVAWDFQNVAGSLRRDDDVLTLEASALPPAEFAEHIELTAQAFVVPDADTGREFTGDWRLSADLDQVDLAVAARLFPPSAVAPQAGRGDWPCGSSGKRACSWAARRTRAGRRDAAKLARRSRLALRARRAVGRLAAHERFLAVCAARRRRHARRPRLARSGDRRHRRPARCRRHPAFRSAQQLLAPRRSDAVLRAVAGVALARIVVRACAARRSARRRHRAHA